MVQLGSKLSARDPWGGEGRQRAVKGSSTPQKPPEGRRALLPHSGCITGQKSFQTPPGGLQERFFSPGLIQSYLTSQVRAANPPGNLQSANYSCTKVVPRSRVWNVGFSVCPSSRGPPPRGGPAGGSRRRVPSRGLPCGGAPRGRRPARPSPPPRAAPRPSHHHVMTLHLRLLVRQLVVLHFEATRAGGAAQAWRPHSLRRARPKGR